MKRQERVELFRQRLIESINGSGLSRSAFARSIGVDRSTLSQLLAPENTRLPRADTLALLAEAHQVSIDWLLGLTQEGHLGTDILPDPLEFEELSAPAASEQLAQWHREAIGYRIRYVPSTLPDLLKTESVIRHEYSGHAPPRSDQRIESSEERLAYQRHPQTEMEVCQSVQSLQGFAWGEGIWSTLGKRSRLRQLDHMESLCQELYPRFRWFLFDALEVYSVPFTVFGPLKAVVYMGQLFLVFNSTEHIRELADRFDSLIRAAVVQPTDIVDFIRELRRDCR